jgi:hypothetical protein
MKAVESKYLKLDFLIDKVQNKMSRSLDDKQNSTKGHSASELKSVPPLIDTSSENYPNYNFIRFQTVLKYRQKEPNKIDT